MNKHLTLLPAVFVLHACGGGGGGSASITTNVSSSPITAPLVSPAQPGDVLLSWDEPSERADGSPLSIGEIGGYQICYTGSDGRVVLVPEEPQMIAAGQTEYTLENLPADTYQFNIFTYDSEGVLSNPSDTVTLPIDQFPTL